MKKNIIISLVVSIIYLIINYSYIKHFYFDEDAYIMFRYVEMFLKGYGITYYPGGEHLEGATDFLWFIFLSILGKVHIDVGIASFFLNTIGVFMITYVIATIIINSKEKILIILLLPFTILWFSFSPLFAALGGFSVYLYCGFILLTLHLLNIEKKILWIPILSIIIGLFRPDGVILGMCFTLIGWYLCKKEEINKYFINIIIALIIGVSYFIWRYNYFGELLPLPLYVKQSKSIWHSIKLNMYDIVSIASILGTVLFSFCFFLQTKKNKKKIFILTIPLILFFTILSLAHQSQNIASRFQAPVMYMGYYLLIVMIINIIKEKIKFRYLYVASFYLLIAASAYSTIMYLRYTTDVNEGTYMNTFPKKFSKYILKDNETVALTEAGRLAYWMRDKPVKIIDLVGLNTKYTAKHPLTAEYIDKIDPDVIMVFINLTFTGDQNIYWIKDKKTMKKSLYALGIEKEHQAMMTTGGYIVDHWDEYDVFFVKFLKYYYLHIYAIKKDKNKSELLYKLLNESFGEYQSYFDLKKE